LVLERHPERAAEDPQSRVYQRLGSLKLDGGITEVRRLKNKKSST
jgi:hypothetical protein